METSDIPSAYADVDVKLNDNGEEFETLMVAGLVGARVCNSGDTKLSNTGMGDSLKPVAGWWMFIKKKEDRVPADTGEVVEETVPLPESDSMSLREKVHATKPSFFRGLFGGR